MTGLGSVLPGGAGRAGAGSGGWFEGNGHAAGVAGAGGLVGPREVDGPSRSHPGRRLVTPPEKVHWTFSTRTVCGQLLGTQA